MRFAGPEIGFSGGAAGMGVWVGSSGEGVEINEDADVVGAGFGD